MKPLALKICYFAWQCLNSCLRYPEFIDDIFSVRGDIFDHAYVLRPSALYFCFAATASGTYDLQLLFLGSPRSPDTICISSSNNLLELLRGISS